METVREIALIAIAALGLLIAATGCADQPGAQLRGLVCPDAASAAATFHPAAGCAAAQPKGARLYEVSARTLILAETLLACSRRDIACTEDDGRSLQASAEAALEDLAGLVSAGGLRGAALTREEGAALRAWLYEVRDRFSRQELPDGACAKARMLVALALQLVQAVII